MTALTSVKIGEGYLSKSGKSLMLKVHDPKKTLFPEYQFIPLKDLKDFMVKKRGTVRVFLVVAEEPYKPKVKE